MLDAYRSGQEEKQDHTSGDFISRCCLYQAVLISFGSLSIKQTFTAIAYQCQII
jgi:hypothetical protein